MKIWCSLNGNPANRCRESCALWSSFPVAYPRYFTDFFWETSWDVNPNVAAPFRGKTRKSASDEAPRSLGQVEAYLTVRQVLSEASTASDGVLSRERSGFCRFGSAIFRVNN